MADDTHLLDVDVQTLMRGLVHELRNPLSAILTASSLLPGAAGLDEETAMLLDVVSKEARRMNRILTEFSIFAKPPKAHPEALDLAGLAREFVSKSQGEGEAMVLHDELPPTLLAFADPQGVALALKHILENASEAVPEGGHVRLAGGHAQAGVWLSITDSGPGLSEQALEQAFQPFFSNKPSATGLGLSIARAMLRASNGDCRIANAGDTTSNEGPRGAVVILELPSALHQETSAAA